MKMRYIKFMLLVTFCYLSFLLFKDAMMIDMALDVEIKMKRFCQENRRYPTKKELQVLVPVLYETQDWYYFTQGHHGRKGVFQYPMNLPIPFAPGRMKLSEFLPIVYAYAIVNPCQF